MGFYIVNEDITEMEVDAVVTAANAQLAGGGGVDGAIHRAAGPELLKACKEIGGCATGDAVITWAYDLDTSYVIHAVGPVYKDGNHDEEQLLRSAYEKAAALAVTHDCRSVAFPLISAGVYGYPKEAALDVAVEELKKAAEENEKLDIYLTIFDAAVFEMAKAKYAEFLETE